MKYISTRNSTARENFFRILLFKSLPSDGGLYIPSEVWPKIDINNLREFKIP